jgi:hypothetical protein
LIGVLLGALVGGAHLYTRETVPQFSDWVQSWAYGEMAAWRDGRPLESTPAYTYKYGSACGIGYYTHHPLLASYVGLAAERLLGVSPQRAIAAGLALSAAALVYLLTVRRSIRAGLAISGAMIASLYAAPGYARWLQHPIGDTWSVAVLYLIACAGMARRPIRWMAVVCFVAGWVSINLTCVFAGMVAGVLFAAQGFGRTTWLAAGAAIVAFCGANLLHLAQVWCHFGWDWGMVVADYFVGLPDNGSQTSLLFRLTALPLPVRIAEAQQSISAYWREALANSHGAWTTPAWWALMLVCCVTVPRTGRGLVGAAALVAGAAATAVVAPGLLPPHLHYLPRYVVIVCLGALVCCAVAPADDASDPVGPATAGGD